MNWKITIISSEKITDIMTGDCSKEQPLHDTSSNYVVFPPVI